MVVVNTINFSITKSQNYTYHGVKRLAEAESLCEDTLWSGVGDLVMVKKFEVLETNSIFTGLI